MYRVPLVVFNPSWRCVRRPGLRPPQPGATSLSVQFWRMKRVPPPVWKAEVGLGSVMSCREEMENSGTQEPPFYPAPPHLRIRRRPG